MTRLRLLESPIDRLYWDFPWIDDDDGEKALGRKAARSQNAPISCRILAADSLVKFGRNGIAEIRAAVSTEMAVGWRYLLANLSRISINFRSSQLRLANCISCAPHGSREDRAFSRLWK